MLDWTRWNRGNLAKIHGSIPMHFRGRRKAYIPPIQHKQIKTRKATILHTGSRAREKWKFFLKIRDLSFSRTNYLIQFKLEKRAHGNNRQNCKRDSIESLVPRRRAVGHVRYEESVSSNDFRFGAHTSTIAFLVRPTCSASNSLIETAWLSDYIYITCTYIQKMKERNFYPHFIKFNANLNCLKT